MSDTPVADGLRSTADKWNEIKGGFTSPVNIQGGSIDASAIGESVARLADMVELAERGAADPVLKCVHWSSIVQNITNLRNYVQNVVNQNSTQQAFQGQAQNIVNMVWSLRSSVIWLLPYSSAESLNAWCPTVGELVASAARVAELRSDSEIADKKIQSGVKSVTEHAAQVEQSTVRVQGFERTSENASSSAEASSTAAKETVTALEKLLVNDKSQSDALSKLLVEFGTKRELVDSTLEGASRVALAESFHDRRKALNRERWGWVSGFIIGIAIMILIGFYTIPITVTKAESTGMVPYFEILRHVAIFAPLVWATWFAARKAGQTMRLAEDYAFKEAAAHSFVGYKREMGDDGEMLNRLREYAIKNFGADPLRVIGDDEPASPVHYVLERLLQRIDKLKPEEALKALGDLAKAVGQIRG